MSTEAALKRMEGKIDRIQQDVEFIKDDHGKKLDEHGKKLNEHDSRFDRIERGIEENRKLIITNQEGIASNREGIASNREMILENRKVIDQLHLAVIRIEQVHGNKLDALMDGHAVMSNRFHRIEQRMDMQQMRMDGFEQNFARLETGQQEIKQTVEKLVSVVSAHEGRLQKIEMKDAS
jgi:hypothetical protein